MGLDLDIIKDTGELIDRYPIKWLYEYDISFFSLFGIRFNNSTNAIIYCEEQIEILKVKVNEFNKIKKIKYLEFDEKKEYLINLIGGTNNDVEINELIEKMYQIIYEDIDDINNDLLNKFKYFKLFLENYPSYKCEISF